MTRTKTRATAAAVAVMVLLAGACSEVRLIGDDRDAGLGGFGVGGAVSPTGGAGGGPIDPDAAARVAVRLWSCGLGDVPAVSLVRFYTRLPGPDDGIGRLAQAIPCIDAQPDGCLGVFSCLGISAGTNPSCTDGCTGDILHTCDGSTDRTLDCKKLGLTCAPDAKRCLASPLGPACDAATTPQLCAAGAPEACNGHVVHGPDCATFGLGCGLLDLGMPNAVCQGEGAACDGTLSFFGVDLSTGIACEGNLLRTCVNGREHVVDCTAQGVGFTCQTTDVGAYCGLSDFCTPPGSDPPMCVPGTKSLMICNAGRRDQVPCDQLGFVLCDVDHCANALGGP